MRTILKYCSVILLFFTGCNQHKPGKIAEAINGAKIKSLVIRAISADTTANDSLSGLINLFYPVDKNYNSLNIDSIKTESGKTLYTVLLVYPNPVYNKFAVYGTDLTPYILDNSLNGSLSLGSVILNGDKYIEIKESFYPKNNLILTRLSLYKIFPNSIKMVFRNFSELSEPGNEYYQQIVELSPDRIRTSINSKNNSIMTNKGDIFLWNASKNEYISQDSVFYKFVTDKISSSKGTPDKKEISSEEDALHSVGITTKSDTETHKDFRLSLSNDWKELDNLKITLDSNVEKKGIKFINANIGASITVFPLKPGDKTENLIKSSFLHKESKNNKFRYSREVISGKNILQFWEYSCPSKKYLMILEASKYTFDRYKKMYLSIIHSFDAGC